MRTARDDKPWYRQLWPWLVILPPAATVIGGFLTLGLALWYPEYDVRDDHYRDGLGVYRAADGNVPAGADAVLVMLADGRVEITMSEPLNSAALSLWFVHPTNAADDRRVELVSLGRGRFEGSVELPPSAHWTAALRDEAAGWQLIGRFESAGQAVQLAPARSRQEAP